MLSKVCRYSAVLLLAFALFARAGVLYAEELVVYLKPDGSDQADGLTQATAVASLQAALDRALAKARQQHALLRIKVSAGNYFGQHAVTSGSPDAKPLVIMPARGDERPRFDGSSTGGTWLVLKNSRGKPTRLTIEGLEISNYITAISLRGERRDPAASNSENVIRNNIFRNIGQMAHPGAKPSTAAIRLVNSDNNIISQNRFENIRNGTECELLHSIYIAHYSTNNRIVDNTFNGGCGDTIKIRDASHFNVVRNNRFIAQDTMATLQEWYCHRDRRSDCTKDSPECPSLEILYENNEINIADASPPPQPVRTRSGAAPTACPRATPGMIQVREMGTRIVR